MMTGTTTFPTVIAAPSSTVPANAATTPVVPDPADRTSEHATTPSRATVTAEYGPSRAMRGDAARATMQTHKGRMPTISHHEVWSRPSLVRAPALTHSRA